MRLFLFVFRSGVMMTAANFKFNKHVVRNEKWEWECEWNHWLWILFYEKWWVDLKCSQMQCQCERDHSNQVECFQYKFKNIFLFSSVTIDRWIEALKVFDTKGFFFSSQNNVVRVVVVVVAVVWLLSMKHVNQFLAHKHLLEWLASIIHLIKNKNKTSGRCQCSGSPLMGVRMLKILTDFV